MITRAQLEPMLNSVVLAASTILNTTMYTRRQRPRRHRTGDAASLSVTERKGDSGNESDSEEESQANSESGDDSEDNENSLFPPSHSRIVSSLSQGSNNRSRITITTAVPGTKEGPASGGVDSQPSPFTATSAPFGFPSDPSLADAAATSMVPSCSFPDFKKLDNADSGYTSNGSVASEKRRRPLGQPCSSMRPPGLSRSSSCNRTDRLNERVKQMVDDAFDRSHIGPDGKLSLEQFKE